MEKITHITFFVGCKPLPTLEVEQSELTPPGTMSNESGYKDTYTVKGILYNVRGITFHELRSLIPKTEFFGIVKEKDGKEYRCDMSWLYIGDMVNGWGNHSFSVDFRPTGSIRLTATPNQS